jgi:predicted ATP-binding protein involved in virulence
MLFYFYLIQFESIKFYFSDGNYVLIKKEQPSQKDKNILITLYLPNIKEPKFYNIISDLLLRREIIFYHENKVRKNYRPSIELDLTNYNNLISLLKIHIKDLSAYRFNGDTFDVEIDKYFNSNSVSLISDQRLMNLNTERGLGAPQQLLYADVNITNVEFLKEIFNTYNTEYSNIAKTLDNTFPKRMVQFREKLSGSEFQSRLKKLQEKQGKLVKYGVYEDIIQIDNYDDENAKALTLLLQDAETKASVFDELLKKLELFSSIIESKLFSSKKMIINAKTGFQFVDNKVNIIDLNNLSSGERHELILAFNLIFSEVENDKMRIILIDEPEMSLHVAWQKRFIEDLEKIQAVNPFVAIIATHSPQIINGNWDNVQDLFTLSKGSINV